MFGFGLRANERQDAAYWRKSYEELVQQTGRDLNDGYGICACRPVPSPVSKKSAPDCPYGKETSPMPETISPREKVEGIIRANVRSHGRGGTLSFTGVEHCAKLILATNADLSARLIEAERKLAEAVGLLQEYVFQIETPELLASARTFLSKEHV